MPTATFKTDDSVVSVDSSSSPQTANSSPHTVNQRYPNRSDSRPLTGPVTIIAIDAGTNISPICCGENPSAACM